MNIESLLKVGESQGLKATSAGSPEFREGNIRGGQVQIGRPAQQVGPTSEEALYGALAEVAGGLQRGIDTFSQIRTQVEKKEIEEAKNKYKEIFTGEYYEEQQPDGTAVRKFKDPSQKLDEWNNYIKDVWTPLLGSSWIDEINMEAYSAFGSREAQEKFEAERYQREAVKFFKDPKNSTRLNQNSPIARMEFDSYYLSKYPTASSNAWFSAIQQDNISKYQTEETSFAVQALEESLSLILPMPNEEQLTKAAIGGTTEANAIQNQYALFFTEVLPTIRASRSSVEASKYLYEFYRKRLIEENPNNYTPDTLVVLDKHLKGIVKRQATALIDLKRSFNVTQTQQAANQAFVTSTQNLESNPSRESLFSFVANARRAATNSNKSSAEQQMAFGTALVYGWNLLYNTNSQKLNNPITRKSTDFPGYLVIKHEALSVFDTLDKELPKGESRDLSHLSPKKQFEIVSLLMLEEILNDPSETEQVMTLLGVETIPQLIEKYTTISKAQSFSSKEISDADSAWYADKTQQTNRVVSYIQQYGTVNEISKAVNSSIELRANELGLPVDLLRSVYFKTDGTYNPDFNITTWYRELSSENKAIVDKVGYGTNLQAINTKAKEAYSIEQSAITRYKELTKEQEAISKEQGKQTEERLKNAQNQNNNFIFSYKGTVEPQHSGGTLIAGVAAGKANSAAIEDKTKRETTDMIKATALAMDAVNNAPTDKDGNIVVSPGSPLVLQLELLVKNEALENSDLPEEREVGRKVKESAFALLTGVQESEASLYSPFISLMVERGESLGLNLTRDQIVPIVDGFRKKFKERFLAGETSYNGTYDLDKAFDSRGQLSYDTFEYLMLTSLVVKDLSRAKDTSTGKLIQEELGTIFKNLTSKIASNPNPEDFISNPNNIVPYLGFLVYGQELQRGLQSNPSIVSGGANWFNQRLAITASIASGVNIQDAIDYFTSPDFRLQASYSYDLPFIISYVSKESMSYGQTATQGTAEDQINLIKPVVFMPSRLAMLGVQQSKTESFSIKQNNPNEINKEYDSVMTGQSIGPEDPNWNPQTFFDAWEIAGLITPGTTKEQLAIQLKEGFLRGSVTNLDSLSTDEILRLGAIVINKLNTGDSRLVEDIIKIAASKEVGIASPAYPLSPNQTFETEFFSYLSAAAGLMQAAKTQALGDPSVTRDTNGQPISYNNSNANHTLVQTSETGFGTVFSVNRNTVETSYWIANVVDSVEKLDKDIFLNLQHNWKPRTEVINNIPTTRDKITYQAGTAVLESLPEIDTIETMIQPYIEEISLGFGLVVVKNSVKSILKTLVTETVRSSQTTFEALQKLNSALIESNFPPIINPESLYQKDANGKFTQSSLPGSSEMVQNANRAAPETMSFTYSWSVLGLNGRPRIHLPNGLFKQGVLSWRKISKVEEEEQRKKENKERADARRILQAQIMSTPARGF